MKMNMKKKKKGFTLLELVIVISIIAILLAIAIPRFSKSNLSAQMAAHNSNVRMLQNAAILYMTDNPDKRNTSLGEAELKSYLQGAFPKPAKSTGSTSFSVKVDESGNVAVEPGMVKIEGDKLVSNDSANTP